MLTKIALASALLFSLPAFGAPDSEQLEMCVYNGPCAARVHAEELDVSIYLVRSYEDYDVLSNYWTRAVFYIVTDEEYDRVRADLPAEPLMLPARAPGTISAGGPRPGSTPTPAPSGGGAKGPLVSGTITVTVGGREECGACHDGDMKEIHKNVLKGPDNGKGK